MQRITLKDIEDLNNHLIPSLKLGANLWALINLDTEYTQQTTWWVFHRDPSTQHIIGALSYDERDFYFTCWAAHPEHLSQLITTTGSDNTSIDDFIGLYKDNNRLFHMGKSQYTHLFARIDCRLVHLVDAYATRYGKKPATRMDYDSWVCDMSKAPPVTSNIMTEPLTLEDAPFIDKYWTYSSSCSLEIFKECIANRKCLCIRDPQTKLPISWGLLRSDYSIGMVHTLDSHRGKGLGKRIVRDLCDIVDATLPSHPELLQNCPIKKPSPFVYIAPDNVPSQQLHAQLGFHQVDNHYWLKL